MPSTVNRALCWIRRDLRLSDHAALEMACELAQSVAVIFVFDTEILDSLEDRADRRVTFIQESLLELDDKLRQAGSQLIVRHGDPVIEIPAAMQALSADGLFFARDYEPYAKERDRQVSEAIVSLGGQVISVKDSVIMEEGEVLNQANLPFRVYTPYSRAWRIAFSAAVDAAEHKPELRKLLPASELETHSVPWTLADLGFEEAELWLKSGEDAALAQLSGFGERATHYQRDRNFPAKEGASAMSVHFRFGTVSIRSAVRLALESGTPGADKWLAELIWRDFYQDILAHFPHVVSRPFQEQYDSISYPGDQGHFEPWCQGMTGYPIVDAAMRCLNETGYMHNRLRMVVASFLTKDLLIDYRLGEAYFARMLLDFDLASNSGGWQWSASVGADAQPYFRIFNPILQSKKFDPDGDFIRRWVPELAAMPDEAIHFPADFGPLNLLSIGIELGVTYPQPIVDHFAQRPRALEMLEAARASAPTAT